MKYFIFSVLLFLSNYHLFAQNGNSCENPIQITSGDYYVQNINGASYSLNCTELDEK